MTTVCLKTKHSVQTEARSNVFSTFNTDAKSCLFIKQLTSTCISTILYLRKIFSDDFFEAKTFEGMTLKILKPRTGDNYVFKIQKWLEGAFDAIEKKYLKRLMLDIQDTDSNNTLEVYTMTFNYNNKKDSHSLFFTAPLNKESEFSDSNTKLSTIKLLQMCYAVTQNYRNLPEKVTLGLRLSYYENTPDDYEPRGYMAWEFGDPAFSQQTRSIEIGITTTEHHFFKLCNKSCLSDKFFKDMEEQMENSNSTAALEGGNFIKAEINSQIMQTNMKKELHFQNPKKELEAQSPVPSKIKAESMFVITEKSASIATKNHTARTNLLKDLKKSKVRCSCLFSKKSQSMFSCLSCKFLVHPECFGILKFDPSKKIRFYCHLCHRKENEYECHDKILISLKNSSHQQKLSLLRRVLHYCNKSDVKTLTANKIKLLVGKRIQEDIIKSVLNKIIDIGVGLLQEKRKSYLIDKNELANKIGKYFYKVRDPDENKQQISLDTPRSFESLKRKDDTEELGQNKKYQKLSTPLQEVNPQNNQTVSQQSYDIFC